MNWSRLGEKYTGDSGISRLMDDLGAALAVPGSTRMLGGGNPAIIPEVASVWRRRMEELLEDADAFERVVGVYDQPQGRRRFTTAVAELLRREFGWNVSEAHVAVTNGSQTASFLLFQLLAGEYSDGARKHILFPLLPEYIGYADQSTNSDDFRACRPSIETIDSHTHKYHVDFDRLPLHSDTAAICVSRPTNPTGNVLTDSEIQRLDSIARDRGIPLIIDNAYGTPFPQIIFTEAAPWWNENVVLLMSLSKIGLPGVRTGIVVADEPIIRALSTANAILSLTNGSIGQALTETLFETGEILEIAKKHVQPFYLTKRDHALACVSRSFGNRFPYSVHRAEGSLFLWIWFQDLPGTTTELYERLMRRNVVIVPGRYFFFGNNDPWEHRDRCIRLNYAMDDEDVEAGIEVIAEEVARMWDGA